MIDVFFVCALLQAPLALSGDESGVWFIGDINPTQATFSGLPLDLDYELCERVSTEQYEVMQLFTRRPMAIAIDKNRVWYIDGTTGIGLYKLQFSVDTKSNLHPSTFEAFIETSNTPTDFLIFEGVPTLAIENSQHDGIELLQFRDRTWESLPSLQGEHARVARVQDQLIAAVPFDSGVRMWSLQDGRWLGGDEYALQGKLVQLISHDDWPILAVEQKNEVTLHGVQRGGLVEITSFATPKGRWGVSSSETGITVFGVQRKGTITLLDIGWPSGSVSEPIILQERKKVGGSMVTTLLFVSMLAVSLILILRMRSSVQKPT